MKVIIAGSRNITDYNAIKNIIEQSQFEITEVVSGMARGIDSLAVKYAQENNIQLKQFPADWNKHGKSAGPIRNTEMANYADALIAIWDGQSRGTKHMIDVATKKGLQVEVFYYD